jgi:alpha-L-fucosidase 2
MHASRFLFLASAILPAALGAEDGLVLFYDEPAVEWTQALPVGNGRLGAMVFGGVQTERLQLNEGTLWAGGPYDPVNPQALEALPEVRRLISDGRYKEAQELISAKMMAVPLWQVPYQTVGSLWLDFAQSGAADYRRDLDLEEATASVSYTAGGVRFSREVFASAPDGVIVVRLGADRPGALSFTARMDTPMKAAVSTEGEGTLVMRGVGGDHAGIAGAIRYEARVLVLAQGGSMSAGEDSISVEGADSVTLLIAVATSFRSYCDVGGDPEAVVRASIEAASAKSFEALREAHVADYRRLFDRVTLDLGPGRADLPTNERIARFADGGDPQLAALYYQFARYLMISSSRPGGQPATLQGLWNESLNPPWQSKYTININTQMNYWPAESGNLAECVEPLFAMVEDLAQTGARTARVMYGAGGWVAHHNSDIWRATAPIDGPLWGMWPTGGAWLCLHLWDRYEYSGERAVLERIYPLMKGASQFFLDALVEDVKSGFLVTSPSISPENWHPFGTSICAGPTMDMQILRDLFANTIEAANRLGVDEDFRARLAEARGRLVPNRIGSGGQLQEWQEDWDMQAPEMNHRHVSHLYGLFPGRNFTLRGDPALAAAARRSLEIRGDESTGWATAWRICLWAHLGDGAHAYEVLRLLISPGLTYPNMFDAHPPFQIDGNFGGAAGIVEMLMQSRAGEIELLPALPPAWPEGRVTGLRARGGFEVDVQWRGGALVRAVVRSERGGSVRLRHGDTVREISLDAGGEYVWDGQ